LVAGPDALTICCKIGFRVHGMAFAMEVIVSMRSGWCIKKVECSLKDISMGEVLVSRRGEMILTMSPSE
jgi:hypothetical protein